MPMAKANVPNKTITLKTFTLHQYNSCINTVKNKKHPPTIIKVFSFTQILLAAVIKAASLIPLISMK